LKKLLPTPPLLPILTDPLGKNGPYPKSSFVMSESNRRLTFNSDIRGEIYERWHGRELGWEGKKKVV
jgi:hypothetical protein